LEPRTQSVMQRVSTVRVRILAKAEGKTDTREWGGSRGREGTGMLTRRAYVRELVCGKIKGEVSKENIRKAQRWINSLR